MLNQFGAYVCQGCGLGDRLNLDQLATIAEREGKATLVKQHPMLCRQDGVDLIKKDIEEQGLQGVVLAACSQRAKTDVFDFDNVCQVRTSLREGVIWTQADKPENQETTDEMAQDYVRMGCAQIKQMKQAGASGEQSLNKTILVVGGGITGIQAALEASAAGYQAILVEKQEKLGGMMGAVYKKLPNKSSDMALQENDTDALIQAVTTDKNITVLTQAHIDKTSGAPGRFQTTISHAGKQDTYTVGAIVQATGFKDYDANKLSEFSYRDCADVITQKELEALAIKANGDAIKRPSDGKIVNRVVFIQCAGQRSEKANHLSYCSGFCCNTSLKQARYFKEQNPAIDTEIIYSDLITAGSVGENLYRSAQMAGVTFSQGVVQSVDKETNVVFDDLILAQERHIAADLVVLATGMVPNSGVAIDVDEVNNADNIENTDKTSIAVESILNLDYRQGPDLPQLNYGFNDSHFICFPYESQRTGIYAAGPVRRPMDGYQAKQDATGAAMKAISALENASVGKAQAPRAGDLSFPSFDKSGCTKCKRCTVECPFGAIDEDEQGYPVYNESRCRRCGTCMGACPVRVISFDNYNILTVSQQIKAVDVPDEFDEKPRIAVFACQNDALPALDMAAQNGYYHSPWARVFPVRCLGSMSKDWVVDALNDGYDGIVMLGCQTGKDYQCHNVSGATMAKTRMEKIASTLETLQLEPERVQVHEVSIADIEKTSQLIDDMATTIDKIGLSPLKF